MFFKVKVADQVYELDKLTLGEARLLKRDFGLTDLSEFSATDPDVVVGLMFLAFKRAHADQTDEQILKQVEDIDIDDFQPEADEAEEDPTPAASAPPAEASAPVEPVPAGSLATTPETPGAPS